MGRLMKWLLIVGLVGGGVAISAVAIAYLPRGSRVKYLTAVVSRGRVETVVNSTGKVKAVKTVSIGAFASGQVKLYVDYNSKVKKGLDTPDYPNLGAAIVGMLALPISQSHVTSAGALFPDKTLLAEIDPRLLTASVKRDRAALKKELAEKDRVQANVNKARRQWDRMQNLRKINPTFASDEQSDEKYFEYKANLAQLELAEASVDQARAVLENSEANLTYTRVWSTEDGMIIERKVDPGQILRSDFQATELFIIGAEMDKHMDIFGSVDEADIGLITTAYNRQDSASQGAVSFILDAYPGELFHGKIFQIRNNSTIEQNVVTYPVVIRTTNPGGKLRPNMTATITFRIEAKDNVLRLPMAALRFVPLPAQVRPEDRHYLEVNLAGGGGGSKRTVTEKVDLARSRQNRIVWVDDGDFLRAVPIALGLVDRQYAEVVSGDLTEGQNVVTNIDTTVK